MSAQSTPGKIDLAQKQYRDTCIGDAQKYAESIPIRDTLMKHLIDTDTKVSRDTYRRYKYLDTAHLCQHVEVLLTSLSAGQVGQRYVLVFFLSFVRLYMEMSIMSK